MITETERGLSYPLGATVTSNGVNFSVFSKNSTAMELLLFDEVNDSNPSTIFKFDLKKNRTYDYWHLFVPGLKAGQLYAYRADGPFEPEQGHRFDPDKLLLDPYGRGIAVPKKYSRLAAGLPGDNAAFAMKSVVVDPSTYDWEGDAPLERTFADTVIYEMHVAGFTRHPNSGLPAEKRGTYAGLVEKIPYLQELGITAVELLPVFQFDASDAPLGLVNYWGYCPVSFFAPHCAYSSRKDPLGPLDEFRDMVKALHRAGIEVILDVVYNHTAEGNHDGPTICFRGLENSVYYILDSDKRKYRDYTGTGNTLNGNQAPVRRLILDSLSYWVREMHVDGFRFDLASVLSRDESGRPLENPPVIWDIDSDPQLAGTKLMAEAWDAAGLYQVGTFVGDYWKEWNGKFRDDIRSFLRGDEGTVPRVASRLLGSPDIYTNGEQDEPERSINFVTCHDGFTLNDLVSYNEKHNEANGEDNLDGSDQNLSCNYGLEGPTGDPEIEQLRNRQIKNFLAITLLSVGTPMLLMGDEVRRTQAGNNNAYCQDNEISWFDWTLPKKNSGLYRFVQQLIFDRLHRAGLKEDGMITVSEMIRTARIKWHGVKLNRPDYSNHSHSLAGTVYSAETRLIYHLMLNAYWEELDFELPPIGAVHKSKWHRWIDTSLPSPDDISDWSDSPEFLEPVYQVQPRSIVALWSRI
ncbi:MAG: glycogen debranching protein GlgX [Desulfomonilaceae bacterium]